VAGRKRDRDPEFEAAVRYVLRQLNRAPDRIRFGRRSR
jgi:hypothetical protein